MITALIGVGLAASMPVALDAPRAAGNALIACVKHAAGKSIINAGNTPKLAEGGLIYEAATPARLGSMAKTAYGTASFARSPSSEGDVWAVGYDSGVCMVMVIGTPVEPIEQQLVTLFTIPNTWRPEPIPQPDATARWTQYGMSDGVHRYTAQVKVQPLPATPVKGLVMVTVAPETKRK